LLGRGGMGEVRAARDLRLHRDVAIKLLPPDLAGLPMVRRRFLSEARSAAKLAHPHVVAVFDFGEDGGIPFMVMERLNGRTLADVIDDGPMEPEATRRLGVEVLDALTAAHRAGLVHRDIKPANVLVAGPHSWKLGDFGIAKSVTATGPDLTTAGMIVGSPAYLAPERLAGGEATPSTDLYAVGVVLYEALVGRRSRDSVDQLPSFVQTLPPLAQIRPGLPADLVAAVTRATALDPADRFVSAVDMAAALDEPGRPAAAHLPPTAPQLATRPIPARASASNRRRAGLGGLAAATVAAGLVVAIWFGAHHRGSNPTTARSPAVSTPATTTTITAPPATTPPTTPPATVIKPVKAAPPVRHQDSPRGTPRHGRG